MTSFTRTGALLLIAIALALGGVPAVQAQGTADLALQKVLFPGGEPAYAGDQLSWNLTLTNNGPEGATGIQVTEDTTGLGTFTLDSFESGEGTTFDGSVWSIPSLAAGESTTLNLTTTIEGAGDVTNAASVTKADQDDPDATNNLDTAAAGVGASITAEIEVKPETLNLGSRGVFTVFLRFEGDYSPDDVSLEESSLFCNGAGATKIHVNQKDGGTLMAKFRRLDLGVTEPGDDDAAGGEGTDDGGAGDEAPTGEKTLTITCTGTIQFGEETVEVTGSDTVRVTGEKKKGLGALFARFLDTVLPVDDDTNEAVPPTPAPVKNRNRDQVRDGDGDQEKNRVQLRERDGDDGKNRVQLKDGNGDQECDGECPGCTGDCEAAETPGSQGNGKKSGPADDDAVTGSQGNGKKTGPTGDDTGTGSQESGNGQGNGNRPEKEKSNGKK